MCQNCKTFCFLVCLLVLVSCNEAVRQDVAKVNQTDSLKADTIVTESFDVKAFFDNVVKVAKKNDFDTLAQGGLLKSDKIESYLYVSMILRNDYAQPEDLARIHTLYNGVLKSNSIKKADSRDITVDVYVCNDSLSAVFWKEKLMNLYHGTGGEPLKELYYLTVRGNILVHTTTRAFMWEKELDEVQKACEVQL